MKEEILKIEKLDHHGRGIGKINEKIVFVPYTISNDEVKIKITKEKKNFCEAEVLEYINKSNNHIKNDCPYYKICGGCDLRHMSYDEQLKFKENKVQEIIKKFCHEENIKINNIVPSEKQNGYRNKLTLKVGKKLCLNKKNTHDYVEIEECKLASTKINKIIKIINNYNLDSIENVVIRSSYFTDDSMVVFYVKNGHKFNENIEKLKELVTTIVIKNKNDCINIKEKGNIFERLNNLSFKISPASFFQVNSLQTLNLYDLVLEKCKLSGSETVYDLYCGTGTIGIYLSSHCKKVIGIEINEEAVKDARENVKINDIKNCEFYDGDVAEFIKLQKEEADVIVVDPPRSGLDNITISNIIRLNPKRIVYVSCDPVTLARDLDILKEKYDICEITPVDMFPQTYHVECVSVLKIK